MKHIAIITDGNGRWAKKRNLNRSEGHLAGVEKIREIIKAANEFNIKYLTFYALSIENFKRPKKEISFLLSLIKKVFKDEIKELIDEGVRVNFLSDRSLFSKPINLVLDSAEKLTRNNSKIIVNFALGYGSRQEIIHACNNIIKDGVKHVDEEIFSKYLYTKHIPDPDLVIRTSGEQRISNFLLYQISYSELLFVEKYWPDFGRKDLIDAINDYKDRNRRFGGIDES